MILASGPDDALDRLAPVFDAIGQRTLRVGPAGAGTRLKLVVNAWVVTVVQGAAETLALAQGLGLDPTLLFDAIEGGPLDLPYLRAKGAAMLQGEFPPSFSLRLAAKDARLVAETAERVGVDAPVARAIAERFTEAEQEHGDEDLAATFRLSTPDRG